MVKGADALIRASAAAGVDVCFANPGTTEMAMVDSLRTEQSVRAVLALFEGAASGAADGYARIAGKPAAVMLHLGPGLGNATANLHNARRAESPVVCWVGDHTTWLLPHDPPLASDIASIAKGTAQWVRTSTSAETIAKDAVDAIRAAHGPVGGVATLILPADFQEATLPDDAPIAGDRIGRAPRPLDDRAISDTVEKLEAAKCPLVFLGGHATDARALRDGARIAEACGGKLLFEQFPRCARREPGLPSPDKLGYLPFQARAQLGEHDVVLSVGAGAPVCFFGYEGQEPLLTSPEQQVLEPAAGGRDVHEALAAIAEGVGAAKDVQHVAGKGAPAEARDPVNPDSVCRVLARLLPENAIVVDEGITSSLALYPTLTGAAPHEYLACKGGSIGFATPVATGAAVAAPDRRVVTYVGDGSAAYTLQSLWTQAREGLNVTTIVLVNHSYAVLQMELMRTGSPLEGAGKAMTEIVEPNLDFVALAKGFGVPAKAASTVEAFEAALEESFATPGPMLVAAMFR